MYSWGIQTQDHNSGNGIIYDIQENTIGAFDFFTTVTSITFYSAIELPYANYSFSDG
jgi:hypothetical protein